MNKVYYELNSGGSLVSVSKLYRELKRRGVEGVTQSKVQKYLRGNEVNQLFAPSKLKFRTPQTVAYHIFQNGQMELVDISRYRKSKDGYKFLLTCIDILSRMVFIEPLKDKTVLSTIEGAKKS